MNFIDSRKKSEIRNMENHYFKLRLSGYSSFEATEDVTRLIDEDESDKKKSNKNRSQFAALASKQKCKTYESNYKMALWKKKKKKLKKARFGKLRIFIGELIHETTREEVRDALRDLGEYYAERAKEEEKDRIIRDREELEDLRYESARLKRENDELHKKL